MLNKTDVGEGKSVEFAEGGRTLRYCGKQTVSQESSFNLNHRAGIEII
jgi:hypothetical protein